MMALPPASDLACSRLYGKQLESQLRKFLDRHRRARGKLLTVQLQEGVDDKGVVHYTPTGKQDFYRLSRRQCWPVRPVRSQSVEAVNHSQDSRADWN
jgi:hypothetical protein